MVVNQGNREKEKTEKTRLVNISFIYLVFNLWLSVMKVSLESSLSICLLLCPSSICLSVCLTVIGDSRVVFVTEK